MRTAKPGARERRHNTVPLDLVRNRIVACELCPRLRAYCTAIGRTKRRAFRDDVYWAKPVPGFGDPAARVLLLGLAPAAHGANRTGRVFTGDGGGGSGDFLMSALHRAGFASIPTSQRTDDGLQLTDAFIAAAVRCAPPDNKPTPEEVTNCQRHLEDEIAALPGLEVIVALGGIAFSAYLQMLKRQGIPLRPRPVFGHGSVDPLPNGLTLVGCYHPSRQNTHTGRLTASMMDHVFAVVRSRLRAHGSRPVPRAAHIALGITIIVASLLAGDALPTPRRVLAFELPGRLVNLPRDIELPAPRQSPAQRAASNNNPTVVQPAVPAAPVIAAFDLQPETALNEATSGARSSAGLDAIEASGSGVVDGIGVTERPPPIVTPTPIRLHSGMAAPRKTRDVMPTYPAMARTARVQGVVILEAVIDASGRVESAHVLRSIPLLDNSALEAVRQWRFAPARLNGQPVPVVMTVTVTFSLQ